MTTENDAVIWALAQDINDCDALMGVYAAPEWDELTDDYQMWVAALVRETRSRSFDEAARIADAVRNQALKRAKEGYLPYLKGIEADTAGDIATGLRGLSHYAPQLRFSIFRLYDLIGRLKAELAEARIDLQDLRDCFVEGACALEQDAATGEYIADLDTMSADECRNLEEMDERLAKIDQVLAEAEDLP